MDLARRLSLFGLIFAATAAPAQAGTFCVGNPDCPPGAAEYATFSEAEQAGSQDADPDTYLLGAGTFSGPVRLSSGDRLVGSGRGSTFIAGGSGGMLTSVLDAYMSDVTLVLDDANSTGSDAEGGTLERVDVDGMALTVPGIGVLGRSTTYRTGAIALAHGTGIDSGVDGSDLVIDAPTGFFEGDYGGSLTRSTVLAETGVVTAGQGVTVTDSILRLRGDSPVGLRSAGSEFVAGPASITARRVTIVGPGSGIGVDVEGGCGGRFAGALLDKVKIRGFDIDIRRRYLSDRDCESNPVPEEVNVIVRRSVFDPDRLVSEGGHGAIIIEKGRRSRRV